MYLRRTLTKFPLIIVFTKWTEPYKAVSMLKFHGHYQDRIVNHRKRLEELSKAWKKVIIISWCSDNFNKNMIFFSFTYSLSKWLKLSNIIVIGEKMSSVAIRFLNFKNMPVNYGTLFKKIA